MNAMRYSIGVAILIGLLAGIGNASAFSVSGVKWCGNPPAPITVYFNADPTYAYATELAYKGWSASPTTVRFVPGGVISNVTVVSTYVSSGTQAGWQAWTTRNVTGGCINAATVTLNSYWLSGYVVTPLEHRVNVIAHEFGHVMGLEHVTNMDALMYGDHDVFQSRPYIVPVYDDLKGIWYAYNTNPRSPWPDTSVSGSASVTRDAQGYPSSASVSAAGSNTYAFASTAYTVVPSTWRVSYIFAYADLNVDYRASTCVCWLKNPTAQQDRLYDLEIAGDQFLVTYSKADGTLGSYWLCKDGVCTAPVTGKQYALELVVYNEDQGGLPYAYAYVHDRADATEVVHGGCANGGNCITGTKWRFDGSQSYAFGSGVWTDTSGNPLSKVSYGETWSGYS